MQLTQVKSVIFKTHLCTTVPGLLPFLLLLSIGLHTRITRLFVELDCIYHETFHYVFLMGILLILALVSSNTGVYKTVSTSDIRLAEYDVICGKTTTTFKYFVSTCSTHIQQSIKTPKNSRSLSWTQVLTIGLGNDVNLNSTV